jgi:predicted dehydrogenase
MRFALLGTHADGLDMACALAESGRHELAAYTSAEPVPDHILRRWGPGARRVHDLEDLLADPAIETVVVAGSPANRTVQLRRALQSERHVLCVYPPDAVPDGAYEAAMIQNDSHKVLLPLLPYALHPAVTRLAEVVRSGTRPLVEPRLIAVERWATEQVLMETSGRHRPAFPGWDVLRALGGEVAEVSGLAPGEEITTEEPVLLSGRFERGLLFQEALVPYQAEPRWWTVVVGSHGRAELLFPVGPRGPAFLSWREGRGELHEEVWDPWDPWPALVTLFETALGSRLADTPGRTAGGEEYSSSPPHPRTLCPEAGAMAADGSSPGRLTWQDAVRSLELDDAARRSVQRRRSSTMEYQEASEEVGFKGTMTLVGCGLIWLTILIVIVAIWFPKAGWVVVPLLVVFLGLQAFRWIVPRSRPPAP